MVSKELLHRDFIKLSDRLLMSARMVTSGGRVADIGCDHAHTDIWLVKEGIASSAIAMDVGEGPLSHARANVRLYGLEKEIEMRQSDGLEALKPGEADTIIIAGMGGTLTTLILQAGIGTALSARELILQPQSDVWMVRRFLRCHGFAIADEEMCIEDGKFYGTIRAVPVKVTEGAGQTTVRTEGLGQSEILSEYGEWEEDDLAPRNMNESLELLAYDEYGEMLLKKKNPVLRKLIENMLYKNSRILEQIGETKKLQGAEKREYFLHERKMLEYALDFFNIL